MVPVALLLAIGGVLAAPCRPEHDASKCLKMGFPDSTCCAAAATASCVDGYVYSRGEGGCGASSWLDMYGTCCSLPVDCRSETLGSSCPECNVDNDRFCEASDGSGKCTVDGKCLVDCKDHPLGDPCRGCRGEAGKPCATSGEAGTCSTNEHCAIDCTNSLLGGACDTCSGRVGITCSASDDPGICNDAGRCVGVCSDGIQNGDEEGVDCGGRCPNVCSSCDDGTHNGDEEGVDCGGSCQLVCSTCSDGIQNGEEQGVDCGDACSNECPCDDGEATELCSCAGSATNICVIGETCDNVSGICKARSCRVPTEISLLIDDSVSSNCGTTLHAGASCVVTCVTNYTVSGPMECGPSMGTLSKVPACFPEGVETEAIVYVQSKLKLRVDISDSAIVRTSAFDTVMTDSIAGCLNVAETDVEIVNIRLVSRRVLEGMARRLAETAVDIDFRVKALNNAAKATLTTAIDANHDIFISDLFVEVERNSNVRDINLPLLGVELEPATITSIYKAIPTAAPTNVECRDDDKGLESTDWRWNGYTCSTDEEYCKSYEALMREYCPKFCGFCDPCTDGFKNYGEDSVDECSSDITAVIIIAIVVVVLSLAGLAYHQRLRSRRQLAATSKKKSLELSEPSVSLSEVDINLNEESINSALPVKSGNERWSRASIIRFLSNKSEKSQQSVKSAESQRSVNSAELEAKQEEVVNPTMSQDSLDIE